MFVLIELFVNIYLQVISQYQVIHISIKDLDELENMFFVPRDSERPDPGPDHEALSTTRHLSYDVFILNTIWFQLSVSRFVFVTLSK